MVSKQPRGSRVRPRSKESIRLIAEKLRGLLQLGDGQIDLVNLIEVILTGADTSFVYDIMDEAEMGNDHARTYPDQNRIVIRSDVYDGLTRGNARDKFTIAHELGHLFLHCGESSYARGSIAMPHKFFEDSEWQADRFAAELLMPLQIALECRSVEEIMLRFGVSRPAAIIRFRDIQNEKSL